MANYVNITLDNTGVTPLSVKINDDETRTTSTAVALKITLDEADMANADNYEMMITGDVVGASVWEKFVYEKSITLTDGDGIKEVYVLIRDDVYNEGTDMGDSITLYTAMPSVSVSGPTIARISNNDGKNVTTFTFTADKMIDACKVAVVENINVLHDDVTNHILGTANGSKITTVIDGESIDLSESGSVQFNYEAASVGNFESGREFAVTVNGLDLYDISSSDGVKIIKVFVKEKDGNWSV